MRERARLSVLPGGVFVVFIVAFLFAGCWQGSDTGPGEIHWDRQTCERCQMVISERRHAVQIRMLGERQTHAFDDLGCALLWLDEEGLLADGDESPEVWVHDSNGDGWIDARVARFEGGLTTPMAYGFSTAAHGVSFGDVRVQVREAERQRRSRSGNRVHQHDHEKGEDVD